MSIVNATTYQHESGAGSNITLDASGNVVCAADVQMASQNGGQLAGFRNKIINGNMEIWQRGTAVTDGGGVGSYCADRWHFNTASSATASRVGGPISLGFPAAVEFSGAPEGLRQPIELYRNSSGGMAGPFVPGSTWTLSVYSSFDMTGMTPIIAFRQGVGDSSNEVILDSSTPSYSATSTTGDGFTRYTCTITVGNVSPNSASTCLDVVLVGGSFSIPVGGRITGCQFEPGPVATPFEHRPIGTELQLCQRYFQTGGTSVFKMFPVCYSGSGALALSRAFSCFRGVTMRATPTEVFTKTVGPPATVLSSGSTAQQIRVETDGTVPSDGEVRFRYDSANAEL